MSQGDMYGGMGPGPDDDWMARRMWWIAMMLGRIPGPSESIQYGTESQVKVPTMQAGTGILSTVGFMVGLGMMVTQLLWASGFDVGLGDAVLVGTIGLILLTLFVMVSTLYLKGANDKIRLGVSAGAVVVCIAGFLYGMVQFKMGLSHVGWWPSVWRSGAVMVGTGLTIYCAALCYRFLSELIDPLFPEPPALRLINKLLGPDLLKDAPATRAPVVEQRTPIPVNYGAGRQGQVDLSTVDGEFQIVGQETGPDEPAGFSVDPETGNLVWYVMLAHKVGLSRPAIENMNLYLPFNETDDPQVRRKLNKATHSQLIWRGAELGWWIKQGQGSTPIWNEQGKDWVLQRALTMWDELTGGQIAPPDPWTSASYQRGILYRSPEPVEGELEGDVTASQVDSQPAKRGNDWPEFDPDAYTGEID